jgi:hypothetical protein
MWASALFIIVISWTRRIWFAGEEAEREEAREGGRDVVSEPGGRPMGITTGIGEEGREVEWGGAMPGERRGEYMAIGELGREEGRLLLLKSSAARGSLGEML